jgi:hypothetical protein
MVRQHDEQLFLLNEFRTKDGQKNCLAGLPKNKGAQGIGPIAVDPRDRNQGPAKLADLGITKDPAPRERYVVFISSDVIWRVLTRR